MAAPWTALGRFGDPVGSFGGLLGRPVELLGGSLGALGRLRELLGVIFGAFLLDFGAVFLYTTRSAICFNLCFCFCVFLTVSTVVSVFFLSFVGSAGASETL